MQLYNVNIGQIARFDGCSGQLSRKMHACAFSVMCASHDFYLRYVTLG
jgi:hypothetical protein